MELHTSEFVRLSARVPLKRQQGLRVRKTELYLAPQCAMPSTCTLLLMSLDESNELHASVAKIGAVLSRCEGTALAPKKPVYLRVREAVHWDISPQSKLSSCHRGFISSVRLSRALFLNFASLATAASTL